MGPSVQQGALRIEVRVPTLNLKFIGTSADVDLSQMHDFQFGLAVANQRLRDGQGSP